MTTGSAAALARLDEALPVCGVMNLGYALIVDGDLPAARLQGALREVLQLDPLLASAWSWRDGVADAEQFALLAAEHLSTPLAMACPVSAALWSRDQRTHLFLLTMHHGIADGVILDRLARDLTRRLEGKSIEPIAFVPQPRSPAPASCRAPRLDLPSAPPTMRAVCRTAVLGEALSSRFREAVRRWRTTPFAGAVACVVAAVAAWTGEAEVAVTIQIAARNSTAALRAPGPWYDYLNLSFRVFDGDPLRAVLLDVSERLLKGLGTAGWWASGNFEYDCPELLVVFDRHPLSALRIPGCSVRPAAVERHPDRGDGTREYLVATEADIVVFFREQSGVIGISLFTKTRVPDPVAQMLLEAIVSAAREFGDNDQHVVAIPDIPGREAASAVAPWNWPEPRLLDLPLVDAVSPVFRLRTDTLCALARDTRETLKCWGEPPWRRAS